MKKVLIIAAVVLVVRAATAFGALGDIVSSFRAPATQPRGLARQNQYLFVLDYNSPNRVYRVHPTNGSVVGSWPTPYSTGNRGLAYIFGGNLYVGCWSNDTIYRCNSDNGSVIASWAVGHDPQGLAPVQTGDGGSGATSLYCSDSSPSYFWRHHYTTGSVISSFAAPHTGFQDITYDHRNRLIWQYRSFVVYGITTIGSVVASFAWPGHGSYAGMAYHSYYLYISATTQQYIYRVHCPSNVGVAPASLGRVKALFR
jgi:hypothetical protein